MLFEEEKLESVAAEESSEAVAEEKPAKKEKECKCDCKCKKGLSDKALKWIYFGVAVVVTLLVGFLGAMKTLKGIYVGDIMNTTEPLRIIDLPSYISALIDAFSSGGGVDPQGAIYAVYFGFLSVYELAMVIVLVVFFIIMIVNTIFLGVKKFDRDELDESFRKLEKRAVMPFAFFLMFDCFMVVAARPVTSLFIVEIIFLAVMLFANAAVKEIRMQSKEEKLNVSKLVYDCVEVVIVFIALFAIFFGLTREPFFNNMVIAPIMYAASGAMGSPNAAFFLTIAAGILKVVGFFLAISQIRRVVAYYPYDDRKNVEDDEAYAIGGLFGKTIAALVLYVAANVIFYVFDGYASIGDVLTNGVLVLIAVLGIAITLRIARKVDNNQNKKGEDEEEPEAEPAPQE